MTSLLSIEPSALISSRKFLGVMLSPPEPVSESHQSIDPIGIGIADEDAHRNSDVTASATAAHANEVDGECLAAKITKSHELPKLGSTPVRAEEFHLGKRTQLAVFFVPPVNHRLQAAIIKTRVIDREISLWHWLKRRFTDRWWLVAAAPCLVLSRGSPSENPQ
jgi:hypothetical protein